MNLLIRIVAERDDENENEHSKETSSEILADVLKQLKKLGTAKRNIVLDKLKAADLIGNDIDDGYRKPSSSSPKMTDTHKERTALDAETIQDEVEILDLDEPKMGTYQRKRSKSIFFA